MASPSQLKDAEQEPPKESVVSVEAAGQPALPVTQFVDVEVDVPSLLVVVVVVVVVPFALSVLDVVVDVVPVVDVPDDDVLVDVVVDVTGVVEVDEHATQTPVPFTVPQHFVAPLQDDSPGS